MSLIVYSYISTFETVVYITPTEFGSVVSVVGIHVNCEFTTPRSDATQVASEVGDVIPS